MKTFKCIARISSLIPNHVHSNMFIEGEIYYVQKYPKEATAADLFVSVSGKFFNSLGGFEKKDNSILKTICREFLVIIENHEKRIYPARVSKFLPNGELDPAGKPYDLYENHKNDPVGTILHHEAGAPGIGYCREMITRIDKTGVYGVQIENTMRILDPSECV